MGDIKSNAGRALLTIQFPDGPPQDYEVSGILITDEHIAWAEKTMTREEQSQRRSLMWPESTFWASYALTKFWFGVEWTKFQSFIGNRATTSSDPWVRNAHQLQRNLSEKATDDKNETPRVDPLPQIPSGSSRRRKDEVQGAEVKSRQTNPNAPLDPATSQNILDGRRIGALVFLREFLQRLFHKEAPAAFGNPPRGCIKVNGTVEIVGHRGVATAEVVAAYDPKRRAFAFCVPILRTYKPYKQVPRGGSGG